MFDIPAQPASPDCRGVFGKILREAVLVGLIGAAFAFLANQISPRGLRLATNYFPGDAKTIAPAPGRKPPDVSVLPTLPAAPSSSALLAAELQRKGLRLIERPEVEKLFHDPRLQQNLILFIDARDEGHYGEGHIPGAVEFYPYHPEKYLAVVLPACEFAEQIVVYCTGGDCEDSQSAALFLRDAGVPAAKLFVYGDGITGWEAAGLPVESGPRNSGNIHKPAP